jgi:hypothetical protein
VRLGEDVSQGVTVSIRDSVWLLRALYLRVVLELTSNPIWSSG